MSQITETICDQCGARKSKTNGWFLARVADNRILFAHHGDFTDGLDICSESCAMKVLSKFVAKEVIT